MWPVDPEAGGTWIAVNDAGLAMTLLNGSWCEQTDLRQSTASRGTIIPQLIACRSIGSVVAAGASLVAAAFEPFTLVAVHHAQVAVIANVGTTVSHRTDSLSQPLFFTSSSLGSDLVLAPRRALFDAMLGASASPVVAQDAFHRHQWEGRSEISICMSRPDAATVSHTIIDVTEREVAMQYAAADSGSRFGHPFVSRLPRAAGRNLR
jgi:hypothetical protein